MKILLVSLSKNGCNSEPIYSNLIVNYYFRVAKIVENKQEPTTSKTNLTNETMTATKERAESIKPAKSDSLSSLHLFEILSDVVP